MFIKKYENNTRITKNNTKNGGGNILKKFTVYCKIKLGYVKKKQTRLMTNEKIF